MTVAEADVLVTEMLAEAAFTVCTKVFWLVLKFESAPYAAVTV